MKLQLYASNFFDRVNLLQIRNWKYTYKELLFRFDKSICEEKIQLHKIIRSNLLLEINSSFISVWQYLILKKNTRKIRLLFCGNKSGLIKYLDIYNDRNWHTIFHCYRYVNTWNTWLTSVKWVIYAMIIFINSRGE